VKRDFKIFNIIKYRFFDLYRNLYGHFFRLIQTLFKNIFATTNGITRFRLKLFLLKVHFNFRLYYDGMTKGILNQDFESTTVGFKRTHEESDTEITWREVQII
jgi:hypothetical protein